MLIANTPTAIGANKPQKPPPGNKRNLAFGYVKTTMQI